MLKKILIGLGVFVVATIAVILGLAAIQPDSFHIERSAMMKAPPETVYAVLTDFHRSTEWSPFEKADPDMKRTFSGAEKGEGAIYSWDGNSEAGAGKLEIIEAVEPSKIKMTLDFTRPFEASHFVEYKLAPKDGGTQVTWSTYGPSFFISKVMCLLFYDPDQMIGGMFEKGLADLKTLTEKEARSGA